MTNLSKSLKMIFGVFTLLREEKMALDTVSDD
jgi:hypothetical protein